MEQRYFDRFKRRIEKSIAQKLVDYRRTLKNKSDDPDWRDSDVVCLTQETKGSIKTLDYSLQELSKMFKLSYAPVNMNKIDDDMFHIYVPYRKTLI
ncbi:MAG: hypothetical protein Q8N63_08825 [Nanoarchaeota archaeon]|nr:hypothetical protein [Nanoarchaeota archaeon]